MSNSYFSHSRHHTTGQLAKGAVVDDDFDSVEAGFDLVEAAVNEFGDLDQAVTDAEAAAALAEKWAEEIEDTEVTAGKYSALHHAEKAATSAELAATFDPTSYYSKTEIDANTYTQTQVDANTYTRTQIDTNTYTKTAADTLLDGKVAPDDGASATVGGTVRMSVSGTTLYITNDDTDAEA